MGVRAPFFIFFDSVNWIDVDVGCHPLFCLNVVRFMITIDKTMISELSVMVLVFVVYQDEDHNSQAAERTWTITCVAYTLYVDSISIYVIVDGAISLTIKILMQSFHASSLR